MKNLVLVKKYAFGLAQAIDGEKEFETVQADLRAFLNLFTGRNDVRAALQTPFINAERKAAILDNFLTLSGAAEKTRRFLSLLLDHKRFDLLQGIVEALPETWNETQGIMTFEVASVIPLSESQKDRLRRDLEAAEKRPASLVFTIDTGIVGGLSVKKGNIVYDASIQGNLNRMKEQIQQGERSS